MTVLYTAFKQMLIKQCIQKIGFTTAANTSDDLHKSVVLTSNQFIQIYIAFDLHSAPPLYTFAEIGKNIQSAVIVANEEAYFKRTMSIAM